MGIRIEDRISRYVAKLEPSVSGERGHDRLFHAAGVLVNGWALSDEEALTFLFEYNAKCAPPWPTSELKRKLREARKRQDRYRHPVGYLLGSEKPPNTEIRPELVEPIQYPDLSRFRKGYYREFQQAHETKQWNIGALKVAQATGILRFGRVCRQDCWICRDASGLCAEARRLDGKWLSAYKDQEKDLPERKAHTILNSHKEWPVGILPAIPPKEPFTISLYEGAPDLLTGFHFSFLQKRNDILHVAMLGKNAGVHGFHPDSFELLRGRRVRIFPHADSTDLSLHWAVQLLKLDCNVDFFVFEGLHKTGGEPVKDLRDCMQLDPMFSGVLEELFP